MRDRLLEQIVPFIAACLGLAGIASAAYVHAQSQRDLLRMAHDIAEIRVSLELIGRQRTSSQEEEVAALRNRIAVLEQAARLPGARTASSSADGAPLAAPQATAPAEGIGQDCIPEGTRFLAGAGDSYPICDTPVTVSIAVVGEGAITLGNGQIVSVGAPGPLAGSGCNLSVLSAGDISLGGFTELRVTC